MSTYIVKLILNGGQKDTFSKGPIFKIYNSQKFNFQNIQFQKVQFSKYMYNFQKVKFPKCPNFKKSNFQNVVKFILKVGQKDTFE